MSKLRISFACSPYDRLRAVMDGTFEPEGINLNFIPLEVEETFWRQLRHNEFDISEMSLSSYTMARSRGDDRYVAIPVFTSRFFRHSCVYINVDSSISVPEDLKGKLVGVPEYQMTAALWLRGIFQHEYGVCPSDMRWRSGGEETPGRIEKLKISLPKEVDYAPIPSDRTLSGMLEAGEIDALFTARTPSCFLKGSRKVKRLFEDFPTVEKEYFEKTGIFPIMHTVCIKREVYEDNPWVAMSMFKALRAAKDLVIENFKRTEALYATLPWMVYEAERTRFIMGEDWWPYGIDANRKTLEALCEYSFEQGLSERRMTIDELFAPETFDEFKV